MTRALIVTALLLCPLAASAQQRKFFLTKHAAAASQALKACAPGFHMAATFELVDPGVLRYDATKGMTMADSGSGPPVGVQGWIHSGTSAPPWCCNGWTDRSEANTGGVLILAIEPVKGPSVQFSLVSCQGERSVWCIED